MQVAMTPNVEAATPVVFQQAMPPWVTQTPEPSPMLWGRVPSNDRLDEHNGYVGQPQVSKEFLRSVCEPFFEQMLVAVQQALVAQGQHAMPMQQMPCTYTNQQGQCRPCDERSTEEGSDIVSDSGGAFSTIFSPHSGLMTEQESVKFIGEFIPQPAKIIDETKDNERRSLQAQATVCRHWKSKGWCRMESNCKFLHPEHKRGVGASNGKPGGVSRDTIGNADTSCAQVNITSDQLPVTTMDGKSKAGKKRSKGSKGQAGVAKEDAAAPRQSVEIQLVGDAKSSSLNQLEYPPLMMLPPA